MSTEARLTEVGYWDGVHAAEDRAWAGPAVPAPEVGPAGWKARVRRWLGPRLLEAMGGYDDHLLWDVILPPHLAGRAGARAVEVGSAPGEFVTRLKDRFGLDPYGIEYSPRGAELNRRVFAAHGVDPGHVIEVDFFDPELQARHGESFDVVLSRGFIEHFTDVAGVVQRHLDLLRPGGLLVVVIPNLRGLNLALSWLFHREVVAMHNLEIMDRASFLALFDRRQVTPLFCDYFGTFSFYLFNAREGSPLRFLLALCMKVQPLLNAAFRMGLRGRRAESAWLSPSLVFVGVKR